MHYPPEVPIEVCDLFLKLARDAKAAHFRRFSADAILHRIRWYHRVEQGNHEFKCNDHWTAPLSRWAMAVAPELEGFFETRVRKSLITKTITATPWTDSEPAHRYDD